MTPKKEATTQNTQEGSKFSQATETQLPADCN